MRFSGIYIPLITPLAKNKVDYRALRRLVNHYVKQGAHGLVPCGTTGESPTLTYEEHKRIIEVTVEAAAGRVPILAGTGSNETTKAIEFTKHAEAAGADGALVVSPYYNKPTQEGIYRHYKAIAAATRLPVVLYNIPGRTCRNIETATILRLAKIGNIVGIKEASGDINQVMDIISSSRKFTVLSGEDHLIFPVCVLGGHGAIAASAHLMTSEFVTMYEAVITGRLEEARRLHYRLLPMVRLLFVETNPSPVKAALKLIGLIDSDEVRLPLVSASTELKQRLRTELKRLEKKD